MKQILYAYFFASIILFLILSPVLIPEFCRWCKFEYGYYKTLKGKEKIEERKMLITVGGYLFVVASLVTAVFILDWSYIKEFLEFLKYLPW